MSSVARRMPAARAVVALALLAVPGVGLAQPADRTEYRVLATSKTSTMQKEMAEAAAEGFRFGGVMGGETAFGGNEVVVVMTREGGATPRFDYQLLATNRTGTMQRELQQAGDQGYEYRGQTVFTTLFGGREVVVILERDREARKPPRYEYKLVATSKTSTLQKEVAAAGAQGFAFVGLTVASTAMGGAELVAITRRKLGD